ncbi:tetratricopeptide repeat protein 8 [Paragonimus heterotremus]|uniref:Tetratricopeptide repeat protein 8 n=1 Tax=Paragonimus heterotremus TaxID=100268 RepID=A0A8J4TS22_9TREM|nr:tetratricopeptide repeat protein 8 [Paragonimus heterotremus]
MFTLDFALESFFNHNFEYADVACDAILSRNGCNESVWLLKLIVLTEKLYPDTFEEYNPSVAELLMNDNEDIEPTIRANLANDSQSRVYNSGGLSQAMRPTKTSSRPLTGIVRNYSAVKLHDSFEQAIRTARSIHTPRPVSSITGRIPNLVTASMFFSHDDGEFLHVPRLNLTKYAARPEISRCLFEYLFYVVNEVRPALNLANLVCDHQADFKTSSNKPPLLSTTEADWWWLFQKARCLYRLGLLRDAEALLRESSTLHPSVEAHLLSGLIAIRMTQPIGALRIYENALKEFPDNCDLLLNAAHIQEDMGETVKALMLYKEVVNLDNTNIEALASIGTYFFYEDQPEVSLKFYRRILQLGVQSAELYNNLGLCAFYAQQYDSCFGYFNRALEMCSQENAADVYFNVAQVGLNLGDLKLSSQCLRIALTHDCNHAEAYNNLAVIEQHSGNLDTAKSLYHTACQLAPDMFEAHSNSALLAEQLGDLQTSYQLTRRALTIFPNHAEMLHLLRRLYDFFQST